MKSPLYKMFQQLDSSLSEHDFIKAENLLRNLKKENLAVSARILFDNLNKKFSLLSGIDLKFERAIPPLPAEPVTPDGLLSSYDYRTLLDGISLVSCCMNRNDNLKVSLQSWLKLPVNEIVLVDWSSDEPVSSTISDIQDPRIKIIRVENETRWILTYGFNVGLRFASFSKIYKLDADIQVTADFIEQNSFGENEFIRGNWKSAIERDDDSQKFVNGSFGAFKRDLQEIGFYNELIRSYGWDDSDLYNRLAIDQGLRRKYLAYDSLLHLEQDQQERLKHQDVLKNDFIGQFPATELRNSCNKFTTALFNKWNKGLLQDYSINRLSGHLWSCQRTTEDELIPDSVGKDAERHAVIELLSWVSPVWAQNVYDQPWMAEFIYEQYANATPFQETTSILMLGNEFDIHFCQSPNPYGVIKEIKRHFSGKKPSQIKPLYLFEGKNNRIEVNFNQDKIVIQTLESKYFTAVKNLHKKSNCLKTFQDPDISTGSTEADKKAKLSRVLAVSMYDENNIKRVNEYLECIRRNLHQFDVIAIFYERTNGSVYDLISDLNTTHKAKIKAETFWIQIAKRPTFDDIFDTIDFVFPGSIAVVANADIAFDETINRVDDVLRENSFFVLSRNEVNPETGAGDGLVMNSFDLPNSLSADSWIYLAPRRIKFRADFPIGTFHCDSFLNYHIYKSGYELYNPCLSVNAFHIHDPTFNSSETKKNLHAKQIDDVLLRETQLCGGETPIRGVQWCRIKDVAKTEQANQMLTWSNFIINIFVSSDGKNLVYSLAIAVMCLKLAKHVKGNINVSLNIPLEIANSDLGDLLFDALQAVDDKDLNIAITNPGKERPFVEGPEICYKASANFRSLINTYLATFSGNDEIALFETDINFDEVDGHRIVGFNPDISIYFADQQSNDLGTYLLLKTLRKTEFDLIFKIISTLSQKHGDLLPFAEELVIAKAKHDGSSNQQLFDELWTATPKEQRDPFEITFVTSIYKGSEFFAGFLENIAASAIQSNAEVILVDAASTDNEKEIFVSFIEEYPGLEHRFKYITLEEDPGLYNCWKLAIEKSSSKFISNANLDDRRSPYQTAALLDVIRNNPELSGAATAIRATKTKNAAWYSMTKNDYWFCDEASNKIKFESLYLRNENSEIFSKNMMHCMPVWKKSLHDKYGFFNEDRYGTSADWAFWLECTKNGDVFWIKPARLSMYFISDSSHNRSNDTEGKKELTIIKDYLNIEQQTFIQQ